MKKKLGVTTTGKIQRYLDWFTAADLGNDIELVELIYPSEDYKKCSGILLTGGIDVHPSLYDGPLEYPNADEFDINRDKYEMRIYRFAQANQLPVLGICRGMQLVSVLEGGTLVQDLGELNDVHRKTGEHDKVHEVSIVENTLLHTITGQLNGKVNSAHHQAGEPSTLADSLIINARSNGVTEGVEFKDKSDKGFMMCVQWHPERMEGKEESPFSANIKKAFLDAIRSVQ